MYSSTLSWIFKRPVSNNRTVSDMLTQKEFQASQMAIPEMLVKPELQEL